MLNRIPDLKCTGTQILCIQSGNLVARGRDEKRGLVMVSVAKISPSMMVR